MRCDCYIDAFLCIQRSFLLRALAKTFMAEFLAIGVLKFVADCAGFASPILLNLVVNFMEDRQADHRWGYTYAFGLAASSLTVAMCNVHFSLLMNELKLKVRAAVITTVYRHTLSVSSIDLSTFSTGKIVNAVSTDVDVSIENSSNVVLRSCSWEVGICRSQHMRQNPSCGKITSHS